MSVCGGVSGEKNRVALLPVSYSIEENLSSPGIGSRMGGSRKEYGEGTWAEAIGDLGGMVAPPGSAPGSGSIFVDPQN